MVGARGSVLLLLSLAACEVPVLKPGEWGPLRYFDEIAGEPPMRLLPPISDRSGNVYVLNGDRERTDHLVYVGHAEGGWSGGCQAQEGLFGVRGFVGRAADQAWYWSGDALVAVDGSTGSCHEVLDSDPVSGTELRFLAVVPWVQDTPSRTYLFAMIQGAADVLPFHAIIDLDNEVYSSLRAFELPDADLVEVVGTGADPDGGKGYVVVNVTDEDATATYVLFLDAEGRSQKTLDVPEVLEADAILGFVQATRGTGAALLVDGRILVFDDDEARIVYPGEMAPEGLLPAGGKVYVTGVVSDEPVLAPVGVDGVGDLKSFYTSQDAAKAIAGRVKILDERSDPTRDTTWDGPKSAVGSFPFLTPHGLDAYTNDATGWLIAGPSYETGIEVMTAVAYGPVGFEVP